MAFATCDAFGRFSCESQSGSKYECFANEAQVYIFTHIHYGALTCISLVTVEIEFIATRRRLDVLIIFDCIDPGSPTAAGVRIRPAAIRFQNSLESDYPGCDLNINKRDLRPEEKRALRMSRVDKLVQLIFEFLGFGDLPLLILFLENAVKIWHDMAVDLAIYKQDFALERGRGMNGRWERTWSAHNRQ